MEIGTLVFFPFLQVITIGVFDIAIAIAKKYRRNEQGSLIIGSQHTLRLIRIIKRVYAIIIHSIQDELGILCFHTYYHTIRHAKGDNCRSLLPGFVKYALEKVAHVLYVNLDRLVRLLFDRFDNSHDMRILAFYPVALLILNNAFLLLGIVRLHCN